MAAGCRLRCWSPHPTTHYCCQCLQVIHDLLRVAFIALTIAILAPELTALWWDRPLSALTSSTVAHLLSCATFAYSQLPLIPRDALQAVSAVCTIKLRLGPATLYGRYIWESFWRSPFRVPENAGEALLEQFRTALRHTKRDRGCQSERKPPQCPQGGREGVSREYRAVFGVLTDRVSASRLHRT